MRRIVTICGIGLLTTMIFGLLVVKAQEPEWQIHAKWCTTDRGSSYGAYMATCRSYDQFDSVLACQAHNGGALATIRNAGREAVNKFMDNWKPKECK